MKTFFQFRHDDIKDFLGTRVDREDFGHNPISAGRTYQNAYESFVFSWNNLSYYERQRRLLGKRTFRDIELSYILKYIFQEYRVRSLNE